MEAAFNDFEEAAKRLIDGGSDLDQQNAVRADIILVAVQVIGVNQPILMQFRRAVALLCTWRPSKAMPQFLECC